MMDLFTEPSKSFYYEITGNLKTEIVLSFSLHLHLLLHLLTLNFLHSFSFERSSCKSLQLLSPLSTVSNIFVISKFFPITFTQNTSFDEHHRP